MDSSLVNAVTNCPASSASGLVDKSKEWQMEMLMEKLRCKAGQFKSFFESAKALRMSLLEKRYPVDSMERNQLYKCLDTIQQNIKVTSLQAMVERLESVSRQLGLKFMAGPSGLDWFISSDMFYLEVVFECNDTIKDVKIHHEGKVEQQSCEELVSCLTRRDFADFTAQLEGLASIYQLNAEKKVKCKAFSALQSLEADLATLSSLQSIIKEPYNLIHKSPVGVLQKRLGGHPMKLTYFVSPYDLLDPINKLSKPLTVDNLDAGNSVTVCIEGSLSHKLQTSTLITVNTSGKNLVPVYGPLTNQNSANLPACFVLKLSRPMPICVQLVRKIEEVTEIECGDVSMAMPLLSLIVQHANLTASGGPAFDQSPVDNRGLFVVLPDQVHCYFMTENRQLDGILVTSIPFTHPAHVPQVLVYLRQQALLNAVINSCVRSSLSKQVDLEKVIMMEVTPLSHQQVSISLEHPIEESMATAELDLSDITNITCKMYNASSQDNHVTDYVTRVFQRSLSIPITMRALIRSWQQETNQGHRLDNNGILGGGGGGGGGGGSGGNGVGGGSNNMNGGGGTSSGAEHELNIKPDPDMMQTDCGDEPMMMTDSNADSCSDMATKDNVQSESLVVKDSLSPCATNCSINNNNNSNNSVFNFLTSDMRPLNIDLLTSVSSLSVNDNINSSNNNGSSSNNNNNNDDDGVDNNSSCKNDEDINNLTTLVMTDCKDDIDDNFSDTKDEIIRSADCNGGSVGSSSISNIIPVNNIDNIVNNNNNCPTISSSSNNGNGDHNFNSSCKIGTANTRKRKWKETLCGGSSSKSCNENGGGEENDDDIDDDDCEIVLETLCSNENSSSSLLGNSNSDPATISNISLTVNNTGGSSNNNKDPESRGSYRDCSMVSGEPEAKIMKKSLSSSSSSSISSTSNTSSSSSTPTSSSQSPSSILLDLENKNLVPPSVSITPIPTPSINPVVSIERRSGIEIIPLTSSTVSSSITITPIVANKDNLSSSGGSSRKSSKNSDDNKDRKRKRRKEDNSAGMGPPCKQDPLLKPVSVSIKPTDCGSPCPSSPSSIRTPVKSMKHSPSPIYSSPKSSPKHGTSSPSSGKPSVSALKSAVNSPKSDGSSSKSKASSGKDSNRDKERKSSGSSGSSSSGHQSPKLKSSSVKLKQLDLNSSEFISSSTTAYQSGGSTPPSGLSGDSKSQPQVRNRKGSLSAVIDKLKSAQHCTDPVGGAICNDGSGGGKSSSGQSNENSSGWVKDRSITAVGKSVSEKGSSANKQPGDSKVPGEYIVKHSSDGIMKITINKTRSKDSAKTSGGKCSVGGSSSSASGSGSPKTHTGLKPGVNSGPASKKPQQTVSKSTNSNSNKIGSKVSKNVPSSSINRNVKSLLLMNKECKPSRSVRSTSSLSASSSLNFSKSDSKRLSPSAHRDKDDSKLESSLMLAGILPAQLVVEGLVKPFDTSFQIPKLSARTSSNNNNNIGGDNDCKKQSDNNVRSNSAATDLSINKQSCELKNLSGKVLDNNMCSNVDAKSLMNIDSRNDVLLGNTIDNKKDGIVIEPILDSINNSINNNSSNNFSSGSTLTTNFGNNNNLNTGSNSSTTNIIGGGSCANNAINYNNNNINSSCVPILASSSGKVITNTVGSFLESSSIDLKKISSGITTPQEAAEILLDISASLPINKINAANDKHLGSPLPLQKNTPPPPPPPPPPPLPPPPVFPTSPSVQVHIVKSPAPSPLIIPSPHSASPCITDDELMDEALVGIGK